MILIEKTDTKKADWNAIRTEYISGGISQRELAKKYGVSVGTLLYKANGEGWAAEREKVYNNARMKLERKTTEIVANNTEIAARIKSKLLRRLEREIDALPENIGSETRNSVIEKESNKGKHTMKEATKAFKLRDLTAAYKDLTEDLMMSDTSGNELLQSLMDLERRSSRD